MPADPVAFPVLTDGELSIVNEVGTRRRTYEGEFLYRAGDPGYDFYALISGQVEIVSGSGPDQRVVARHGPGSFLGELNLLTGMRVFVSARVVEAGEVVAVGRERFRELVAARPGLSDKILAAFLARRSILLTGAATSIRVVGSRFSSDSRHIREFLARLRIPHEWLDPDHEPAVEDLLHQFSVQPDELPVVIASGVVLRKPTAGLLSEHLGLTLQALPERCFDLVVVGGGPAGLAAAVYAASEGLSTLGVDELGFGGQAGTSSRIENYFGFPTGISGSDLAQRGLVQAEKFGARLTAPCEAVSLREEAGHLLVQLSDGSEVAGRSVVVATGARYRRLSAARLDDFEDRGVYYAATEMEARSCAGSPVIVVGAGNSAGQAAMFLADSGTPVTMVVRRPEIAATMSRYLVDRIQSHPLITVRTESQVTSLEGVESLAAVQVHGPDGDVRLPSVGLFSFIGAEPSSSWLSGCAALDGHGFVLTDRGLDDRDLGSEWTALGRRPLPFETSYPGLFAVGDVRAGSTKRVAAAVGEGSACVGSVHRYLAFAG